MALNRVTLSDGCPRPLLSFDTAGLPAALLAEIAAAGFRSPSAIQAASWAPAMAGRDVVGLAQTGSGKTLAFLAPAFVRIAASASGLILPTLTTLVLAPTRELATQIATECARFGKGIGVASCCLYGGAPRGAQLAEVEAGVHAIVATPGRLLDFLETGQVRLDDVDYLVLDEADRMLDMGFEPQVRAILKIVPRGRQSLMYSATWPDEVRDLATDFLKPDACRVTIGNAGQRLTANANIEQQILFLRSEAEREPLLMRHLAAMRGDDPSGSTKVLVFCATKRSCEALARSLRRTYACAAIHGDKEQSERELALADFRVGKTTLLVATDVAARGLDIPSVDRVINFEFPQRTEDYIHRIGRTGRAGAKGTAVSFMTAADAKHASPLIKILKDAGQKPPKELKQMAKVIKAAAAPAPTINKPAGAGAAAAPASAASGLYGDVTFKF